MSTDITKGPRLCPSCGRENALTAFRCSFCFTAWDQGVQSAPSRQPPAEFAQTWPFRRIDAAPFWNPNHTGLVLIALCFLLGILTFGLGFLLFIPLAPALYRLHRASQCVSDRYNSVGAGCAAWGAGLVIALLVAVSFIVTFAAVCFPIGIAGSRIYSPDAMELVIVVGGFVLGILAGAAVAYIIVRAIFPPHDPQNSSGPRPSVSDED
jgi:hypothetical protein